MEVACAVAVVVEDNASGQGRAWVRLGEVRSVALRRLEGELGGLARLR